MSIWDGFIREKMNELAKCRNVIDVGTNQPFVEDLARFKDAFKDVDYKTLDQQPGADIICDICKMDSVLSESVDGVICRAVLEHTKFPKQAIDEIHRILRPGGKFFGYVPFIYPFHAEEGAYQDYWRFTSQGIKLLLRDFKDIEICPVYGFFETWFRLLPLKFLRRSLAPVGRLLDSITKRYRQTSGFYFYATK